jgi:integrase
VAPGHERDALRGESRPRLLLEDAEPRRYRLGVAGGQSLHRRQAVPGTRARERFFTGDELARIGAALSTAEAEGLEVPGFILLVRLLATTGMRLGEALALTWPNVDLPGRAIRSRRESEGWRSDSTSRCRSGSDP